MTRRLLGWRAGRDATGEQRISFLVASPRSRVGKLIAGCEPPGERYASPMCRSIKRLRDGSVSAPSEEIEAAALQYIRKVSGFQRPAVHNQEVFNRAVADVAEATALLLGDLQIRGAA